MNNPLNSLSSTIAAIKPAATKARTGSSAASSYSALDSAAGSSRQASVSDSVSLSTAALQLAANKQQNDTSVNYDFSNITPQQMQATMNELLRSGKMTLDQSSSLVTMIPTALSNVDGSTSTPASYTQPANFIQLLQTGIQGAQSRGDNASVQHLSATLESLLALQADARS